jgi:hypothetical protein
MASTSNRSNRQKLLPLAKAGLVITPRDVELLTTVWQFRQVTHDQLRRLHFTGVLAPTAGRSKSILTRRLGLLRTHGYLAGRRFPAEGTAGRPPSVYSLGRAAVPLVADALGLESERVERRQLQDAHLSGMFAAHRLAIGDVRIALTVACHAQGHQFSWRSEEELGAVKAQVTIAGEVYPIRPDGFFVLTVHGSGAKAAFFLEVQRASDPIAYRRKVKAYMEYWGSGAYTERFGFKSLRVLAVTTTPKRALQLKAAAEHEGGATLFWSTSLAELVADPLGAIWFVGSMAGRQRLLDE